ncbi:MAG: hypothetical protein IT350_07935 [Deltaproteobacteria bacterium]|nr:hypothetical protein [Deltaproteobacteria bacterium]
MPEAELIDIWSYDAPPNARVPGYQTVAASAGLGSADVRALERRSGVGGAIQAQPNGNAWAFRRFDERRYVFSVRRSVGRRGEGPNHRIACVALVLIAETASRLGFNPRLLLAQGVELAPVSESGATGPRITCQDLLTRTHALGEASRFLLHLPAGITDESARRWQLGEWWKSDPVTTAILAERIARAASATGTVLLCDLDCDAIVAAHAALVLPPADRGRLAYDTFACAEFPLEPGFAWSPSNCVKAVAKTAGSAIRPLPERDDDQPPLDDDMREWLAESFGLARWPREGEAAERVKRPARLYSIVSTAGATVSLLADDERRRAARTLIRCHALLDAAATKPGDIPKVREAFAVAWNSEAGAPFGWLDAAWPRLSEALVLGHSAAVSGDGDVGTHDEVSTPDWGPIVGGDKVARIGEHVDLPLLQICVTSIGTRIRRADDRERLALLEVLFELEPILVRRGGTSFSDGAVPIFVEVVGPDRLAEWGERLAATDSERLRRVAAMAIGRLAAVGHEAAFRYIDALGQREREEPGFLDRVFPHLRRDTGDAAVVVADALLLKDILTPLDYWTRRFRDVQAALAPLETQIDDLDSAFISGESVVELLRRLRPESKWLGDERVRKFAKDAANGFFGDRTTYANPVEAAHLLIRLAGNLLDFDADVGTKTILDLARRYWTCSVERSPEIEDALRDAVGMHPLSSTVVEDDARTWLQGSHPTDDRVCGALDHLERLIARLTPEQQVRLRSAEASSAHLTGFGALFATRILRGPFSVSRSPREEREKVKTLARRLKGQAFCVFVEDWLTRGDPAILPWICEVIAGSAALAENDVWDVVKHRCRTVFRQDTTGWKHFSPFLIARTRYSLSDTGALDEGRAASLAEDLAMWRWRLSCGDTREGTIALKTTLGDIIGQLGSGARGPSSGMAAGNFRTLLAQLRLVDTPCANTFRVLGIDVAARRYRDRTWAAETFDLFVRDLVGVDPLGGSSPGVGSPRRRSEIHGAIDDLMRSPEVLGCQPALGRVVVQILQHAPWHAVRRMSFRWEDIDRSFIRHQAIESTGERISKAFEVAANRPVREHDLAGAPRLDGNELRVETVSESPLERARLDLMRRDLFTTGGAS